MCVNVHMCWYKTKKETLSADCVVVVVGFVCWAKAIGTSVKQSAGKEGERGRRSLSMIDILHIQCLSVKTLELC